MNLINGLRGVFHAASDHLSILMWSRTVPFDAFGFEAQSRRHR